MTPRSVALSQEGARIPGDSPARGAPPRPSEKTSLDTCPRSSSPSGACFQMRRRLLP